MKKGFTLAELLVCVGIIGILCALLAIIVTPKQQNKEMLAFRKAYNTTAKIIYDMMQSNAYYAEPSFSDTNATVIPIDDGTKPSGDTKFCKIFASFLNTKGTVNCTANADPTFTTLDGIKWYIPVSNFSSAQDIKVDVNGNKEPNCDSSVSGCDEPDTFTFNISPSGKISITDPVALRYLEDDSEITRKKKETTKD